MENEKITEHIVHGLEYYMETLALPSHMEKHIVNKTLFDKQIIDPDHYYPLCEGGKIICFLGFCGETPAATSMTLMTDNMGGKLEWIATLPEYRKEGMSTAVCCAGIDQLIKDGAKIITLTAREMGVSLYEILGFKI